MIQKISNFLNHKGFTIFALIVMTYILGAQSDKYYKWTNPPETRKYSINSDGCGYYAYLPQVLIYKTKHFEFAPTIQKKYPGSKFFQGLSPFGEGRMFDKYFVGTAVCISPFFWTAHQVTRMSGGEADGYSENYEIALTLATISYWLLGALSLLALLRSYGIQRFPILFGIAGLTFATNLNFYIIYDPAFSHAFTFGIVCFLLLQTKRYADSKKGKHLIWIIFLLGLIAIIRPTNLIVVLILPFFFDSFKSFFHQLKDIFRKQKVYLSIGIILFASLIFLQFLNVKSQEDYWGFNAYSTEGFDFLFSPKIIEVLFGFRKGFFVYTPFMLLLFPGLYFLFKWNKYFFYGFLLFSAVFIYIMASWWCWYYGGSLGMRPLIDVYGILIIPIILMFAKVNQFLKALFFIFMALMIRFNMTLNYQMTNAILHYAEMDKERFHKIFMQTGYRFEWIFYTHNPEFDEKQYQPLQTYSYNSKKRDWEERSSVTPQSKGTYLENLIYHPSSGLESDIAVKVRYSMQVEDEKSIPKVLLFGFKGDQLEELSVNFMGPQISGLDAYFPVDAELYSSRKYAEFDSLMVVLESGKSQGWIKDAHCTFYKKEATKTLGH